MSTAHDTRALSVEPERAARAPRPTDAGIRAYERDPRCSPVGGAVLSGWETICRSLRPSTAVLAIDGPWILPWERIVAETCLAAERLGRSGGVVDVREALLPWPRIVELSSSDELADDPEFARLSMRSLPELFASLPDPVRRNDELTIVYGPGAALVAHDELWYADLPKRYAEADLTAGRATNLGQRRRQGTGTTRRLFFIDWPILDRHRAAIAGAIDRYVDVQHDVPASVDGTTLRRTLDGLATRPFRTRPSFNSTSWGGHWAERKLGFPPRAGNTALGYELIAPESGLAIGAAQGPTVEVPFDLLVRHRPREIHGDAVVERFGPVFPIRFDYLDTVDGGHLSVHCHPRDDDMQRVFGGPFAQHETYYMMVSHPGGIVHLGLKQDVDVSSFRAAAATAETTGRPFEITRFVQSHPATAHQLYLIPAGTPHGSGSGNVVLEISATPYLYSLRFYDWLRKDTRGHQRPVHVEHAFRNLDTERRGDAVVRDLIPAPQVTARGTGWTEELLGSLPELFFDVRRTTLEPGSRRIEATDRFRVVNVVDGHGVSVAAATGRYDFVYAETFVIPAGVGDFTLEALGDRAVRIVDARVR